MASPICRATPRRGSTDGLYRWGVALRKERVSKDSILQTANRTFGVGFLGKMADIINMYSFDPSNQMNM